MRRGNGRARGKAENQTDQTNPLRKPSSQPYKRLASHAPQLRKYASLTTSTLLSSDFVLCAKHCVSFTKVLSSSPPSNLPRLTSALGETLMCEQEESRKKAVGTITESYKKAIEEGDLPEICRIVPLLGDLDLAEESVGSYLKYLQKLLNKTIGDR
jgi:hypothetical protein